MKKIITAFFGIAALGTFAGVPIKWTVETSRADIQEIDVYHGETLDLEVQFKSYGSVLELPTNEVAMTYWQTNGMGTAYWRTNNVTIVASNGIMRSSFTSAMDVGAKTLRGFMGIAGNIYRASFVLRFKDAPGYDTTIIEWPYRLLDFEQIEVRNAPYYSKEETGAVVTGVVASATNEITRTQPSVISNIVEEITDENVRTNYLCTVAKASEMDAESVKWSADGAGGKRAITIGTRASGRVVGAYTLTIGEDNVDNSLYGLVVGESSEVKNIYSFALGSYCITAGEASMSVGAESEANGYASIAMGTDVKANGYYSQAHGANAKANSEKAWTWNGAEMSLETPYYESHGQGTFNINPAGGVDGLWIGDKTFRQTVTNLAGAISDRMTEQRVGEIIASSNLASVAYVSDEFREKTNRVWKSTGYGSWKVYRDGVDVTSEVKKPYYYSGGSSIVWYIPLKTSDGYGEYAVSNEQGGENATALQYVVTIDDGETSTMVEYTASRGLKADGMLALLEEVEEATNGVMSAIGSVAYSKSSGETLAAQVQSIGAHLNAEDARFVSTNYDSVTKMPEAYVEIKQSNEWIRVWQEMRRWNAWTGNDFDWTSWNGYWTWKTNIESSVSEKSPREYAFYDGVTGNVAPDDFFWISQPHIAVCAGAAYQRYMDGEHEIWVLESNGMVSDVNGTTNGFFRITDSEGETQFEIVKGDKQTIFANANALTRQTVSGVTHYFTTYAVTNAVTTPTAKFTASLTNQVWYADTDSDCPCNVEWTAGSNSYTLAWWPKTSMQSMFVKAEYERGGETYINNVAPTKMQTIMIESKKYSLGTTTVNGETVLKLTEVQ